MKIQRLTVENFKSFNRLDLELGDFNVFIGANASGKTNVLHILEFLRDIATSGLKNAVSMQGDTEFLRNVNIGVSEATRIEIEFKFEAGVGFEERGKLIGHKVQKTVYVFWLEHDKSGFRVVRDRLKISTKRIELERQQDGGVTERDEIGNGEFVMSNDKGTIRFKRFIDGELTSSNDSNFPFGNDEIEILPQRVLLELPVFGAPFFSAREGFEELSIYDFDTKAQRKAVPISGKTEIEEDGGNIALVLKNIIEDGEKSRRFTNLIQYVLPFVSDVAVERFAGRSLIATLEETHTPETYLPASLLSEGTIKIISLLIALYFEDKPVIAFEEPASNLHPHLISQVVEMMKEQAGQKQIFVTTHSPEVIKYAGLENVYLVSRDENGFSKVTKPAEKEEVRIFLENEMGIEDLFVQDLLEV